MNRHFAGLLGMALLAGLISCGGSSAEPCGIGGARSKPEIGGEILYRCSAAGSVHSGLYLLNVSSGVVRRITSDNAWNLDASWSADGQKIVYQSTRDGRSDVYVMDISSGDVHRISDSRGFNGYPSWSPDGQWIAYESSRDGIEATPDPPGYYREIYLVRVDGSDRHRLLATHAIQSGAAWSPSGDRIVFGSDMAGAFDLYTVGADGSNLRQLTHHERSGGFATYARWSPDGSRIAFNATSSRSNHSEIYWLPAGGGESHRMTDEPAALWDAWPDWSPDSSWIAYARNENGLQLFAIDAEGRQHPVQLTDGGGDKDQPRWRPA